jgi:hypothetical protein
LFDLLLEGAILLLQLVGFGHLSILGQDLEPVQEFGVVDHRSRILHAVDPAVLVCIDLVENLLNQLFIEFYLLVYKTGPMLHHVCEVVLKLDTIYVTMVFSVHQPKTKLVALLLAAIAQDVHNVGELLKR